MAIAVEVGSFTKQATTGNQDITISTNLTAAAAGSWAVIFWMSGSDAAAGTWDAHINASLGFAANGGGTISQYVAATNSDDNSATSQTTRRMAAGVISINFTEIVRAEAEMGATPFPTSTTMRVNWTTNTTSAPWAAANVNYCIISGLTGAKVVNWSLGGATGNRSVTGVGFNPDLVLHALSGSAVALPHSGVHSYFGFGAMNKHGQQWVNSFVSVDAVNPSNASRGQQTDACILSVDANEAVGVQSHYVSTDADGFTVYNTTANDRQVISLCLDGVSSKIGALVQPTGTGAQVVDSRQGFTPKALMMSGLRRPPAGAPEASAIWGLGVSDLTNERSVALSDIDAQSPTTADSVWHNDKVFVTGNAATDNAADLSSVATDSFTLGWTLTSGAHEVLYLLLGDSGTDTFPVKIALTGESSAPAAATATAYSNQKKETTLSTGRKVIVIKDTDDNAELRWSDDDFQTTAEYGAAGIAGWSNGSIGSYTDSGGTKRLVAVWKQAGTGGGRTSGYVYMMAGTLSSSDTVLTWGTALALNTDTNYNYPDLSAHSWLTGGLVHIVTSGAAAVPVTTCLYQRYSISGTTFTGEDTGSTLGSNGSVNVHQWPSCDYDPVGQRVHVARSKGTTGAGNGLRYTPIVYSGGGTVWNIGTEVEVDTGHYVLNDDLGIICRWDAGRSLVCIGGLFYDGTNIRIRGYDSSNFTAFTNRVDAAGAGVGTSGGRAPSFAIDSATGDWYFFGNMFFGSGYYGSVGYYKATRSGSTLTLGSQVITDGGSVPTDDAGVNAFPITGGIGWIYTRGNNSPYAVVYDRIILTTTPTAPTLTAYSDGSVQDLAAGATFTWTHNDVDGEAQAAYAFKRTYSSTTEYWNASTSLWQGTEVYNSSATQSVTMGAGKWTNGTTYQWTVSTRDAGPRTGPYATAFTVIGSTPPVTTITAPSGTITGTTRPIVVWTFADSESDAQSTYHVKVESGAYSTTPGSGTSVYDSTETTSTAVTKQITTDLVDGTTYRVFVRTKANTQYSTWAYSTFTVSANVPAVPTVVATALPSSARISVAVQGHDNLLTTNQASAETDTAGFAADTNCSIAQSAAHAADASNSIRMSSTAAGTMVMRLTYATTIAGQIYSFMASVKSPTAVRTCRVGVEWQDSSGTIIGSRSWGSTFSSATGAFTQGTHLTQTAPALAVRAVLLVEVQGTAGAAELVYWDKFKIAPGTNSTWTLGGISATTTFIVERSLNGGSTWSTVRDSSSVAHAGAPTQTATVYDYESNLTTATLYRAKTTVEV